MEEDGTFEVLPKKEVIKLKNEREKLEKNLRWNQKNGEEKLELLFVVDPRKEKNAISRS